MHDGILDFQVWPFSCWYNTNSQHIKVLLADIMLIL